MATELREGQEVNVVAEPKTASGHPASYQVGSAVWESSDDTIAKVNVDQTNELTATVQGIDGSNNGAAVISLHLDGDPDDNETRPIVATLDVVVTQGEATVIDLSVGTPRDIQP